MTSNISQILEELACIHEKKVDLNTIPNKNKNGDCYVSAYRSLQEFTRKGVKKVKLVHGIVTGQGAIKGIQYGHAWIEMNGTVIDSSNGRNIVLPKRVYYTLGQIEVTREYTYDEALEQAARYGTYGPWDKVFKDCL